MARYILKRFFLTLLALWLVLTLVFLMIHIVPGDPVEQMLIEGAAPGQLAQLAFLALIVSAAIAIPAGMLAAYRHGQTPGRARRVCSFRMIDDTG